jgi:HEAT repeat protein
LENARLDFARLSSCGMGKKRVLLLAVLFAALLGGAVWMLSRPPEPAYQGKPLSAWLKEYNGVLGDTNQAAFVVFREMGTDAIPALLKIMQSDDPPLFQRMMSELDRRQSLVYFPVRGSWEQRWAASSALYVMGASAKPAFPVLTNLLFRTNTFWLGAVPLAGMGSDGLAPLIAALTNQNSFIRFSAAIALPWERSDLNIVVLALIDRLSDQDNLVHQTAVTALGELHAEPGLAVPALMKDFARKDSNLRGQILGVIGGFGTNASAAVPMLLEALSDSDQTVRTVAASALKQIDPAAAAKAGVK